MAGLERNALRSPFQIKKGAYYEYSKIFALLQKGEYSCLWLEGIRTNVFGVCEVAPEGCNLGER